MEMIRDKAIRITLNKISHSKKEDVQKTIVVFLSREKQFPVIRSVKNVIKAFWFERIKISHVTEICG